VREAIATNGSLDAEYRIIRPDGAVRWIFSRGRLYAEGPSPRMVGVNIDITERKQAEEELRHATIRLEILSDAARLLLASDEPEQIVQTICERIMKHLNCQMFFNYLTVENSHMHLNAYAGISPETAKKIEFLDFGQAVCGCVGRDGSRIVEENILQTRGETTEIVRSFGIRANACHPLVYRGETIGTLWFGTTRRDRFEDEELDIMRAVSDLAATAMARKRTEEALREADRRKDEFLAMLGHELRNPLNVIITSMELLRAHDMPEAMLSELQAMIMGQVSHMVRLVDDLLDVSRITHGQVRVELRPCDLTWLAHETVEEHRGLFESAALSLIAELPEEPLWVFGDGTRLKQAIGNGLQNAHKFTDSGGTVAVTLRKADGDDTAVLTIRDTGIGMDQEMLRRAFEPFSQAEIGVRRSRGGLGLGLAVVKGLVDLHNGNVTLRSAGLGQGSELMIRLPLSQLPPSNFEAVLPPSERTSRSRRILLIEDNPMGSRAMRLLLTRLGHEVQVAHTGREGIEAARQFDPEVVLCDIGLPDVDGFAVARALRREPITVDAYLIALSGYGQTEYQRKALEAGFNTHLTKPVHIDDLSELLNRAPIRKDAATA
jgi:signal transduction histidine kinase/ActR/RegA family two-component response regulator